MSRLSFAAAVLFAAPLFAQPLFAQTPTAAPPPKATITAPPVGFAKSIVLWPDGAPGAHGTTEGDVPKLFTYPAQGAGPHASVIVMPGGGYTHLVMEMEGAYEARWLAMHGINAFVLEYRLSPAYVYPTQMLDGSRAIRYVRSHAAELGVKPDQIGIWGFSAGGHLAGYMATIHTAGDPNAADPINRVADRPDFAIISYGGLSMDVTTRAGGVPQQSILGPHPTQAAVDSIDPVKHVSADTCPSFIYSTTGDKTVDSHNASEFYGALKTAGVPAELHIFEVGPHGTHMGENLAPALHELTITPVLLENWLQLHGWMSAEAQYN